ncbi:MAG: hypothetical protein CMP91_07250 [Gammaproteobacteria bacterium]|nr:hypothetical protein [Gammaproteobacteria bacterium]
MICLFLSPFFFAQALPAHSPLPGSVVAGNQTGKVEQSARITGAQLHCSVNRNDVRVTLSCFID